MTTGNRIIVSERVMKIFVEQQDLNDTSGSTVPTLKMH